MEHTNWIQIAGWVLGPVGAAFGAYLGLRITLTKLELEINHMNGSFVDLKKEVAVVEERLVERIESNEGRIERIESTYFRGTP